MESPGGTPFGCRMIVGTQAPDGLVRPDACQPALSPNNHLQPRHLSTLSYRDDLQVDPSPGSPQRHISIPSQKGPYSSTGATEPYGAA